MTCIVGAIEKGKIYIGADSAGTSGYSIHGRKDVKVFTNHGFIMGFTSSFRMGQLLRYKFMPPPRKEGQDLFEYMVTDFIDNLKACFKNNGYSAINNNVETGGTFLVGHQGRLFTIYEDYQVCESCEDYECIGCGADLALGSMYSTIGNATEQRIQLALETAEKFNAAVRRPFNILAL